MMTTMTAALYKDRRMPTANYRPLLSAERRSVELMMWTGRKTSAAADAGQTPSL